MTNWGLVNSLSHASVNPSVSDDHWRHDNMATKNPPGVYPVLKAIWIGTGEQKFNREDYSKVQNKFKFDVKSRRDEGR